MIIKNITKEQLELIILNGDYSLDEKKACLLEYTAREVISSHMDSAVRHKYEVYYDETK